MILTLLCGLVVGYNDDLKANLLTQPDIAPSVEALPLPNSIQELPRFLDQFLPPEGRGKTQLIPLHSNPNEYIILCKFTLDKEYENEQLMLEKIARDFIFATYESCYERDLPIVSSTIFIKCKNDKPGLTVGIGKKVADTIDPRTWQNRDDDPGKFMDWLYTHKCRAPDSWQKCSYAGIFAR